MTGCGSIKGPTFSFLNVKVCKGIGRKVVEARIGMSSHLQKPDDIKWCSECGRYYNPSSPHECNAKAINENRSSLEKFLKRYKVKEES